ncbi:MAG: bifunctional DNA-formamidopyrimidine glycosylase/DNA-(apurinic or apyrimidinic site) lyase [Proteobacteria bacterium]|jgi:formamidopyrimidine-DNA glycosylase|nr:bifunctional DNA-formamidopyrimidine glycosylase/DNA-(apurinic or apyrimidinic site) lyase [Pseudomonadota bacterium]
MPELPEVETTRCGIEPYLLNQCIRRVAVRQPSLRWPVPQDLDEVFAGEKILKVSRRAKYLLIEGASHTLIIHLGMSGSLRIVLNDSEPQKHDHLDIVLSNERILRFRDPRRFGCVLYSENSELSTHVLLANLGPEPLDDTFSADYLFKQTRKRNVAIKNFIMNGNFVVGVGNIYASEALHMAGIMPGKAARRISRDGCERLIREIKTVLTSAIEAGGTTLKDFTNEDGKPGYFSQQLQVYGRSGEPCYRCGDSVRSRVLGQRSTFYCSGCQT